MNSMATAGEAVAGRPGRLRWSIALLLFAATVINYVDRQTLSVLAPVLRDRFGMSNTDYSHIVFAFLLAYMIMQTGSGRMMDRLGTRRGFAITIAVWSVAAMLHSLAASALAFAACRFLLGLGEAGNWPGGIKAVSEWFPPKERATAVGIFNGGSVIGALFAPPLVTWIALTFDWRAAFLLTGLLGFAWLGVWLWFYYPPQLHARLTPKELRYIREGGQEPATGSAAPAGEGRALLRDRRVWGLVLSRIFADPVWWFYAFWLPEYLKRERGFSLAAIGYVSAIPFAAAGAGSLAGGVASGWLVRKGWPVLRARKMVLLVSAVCMLPGIPAVLTGSSTLAIALISVTTFAYCSWASNLLTLPADLFPRSVVASVSGMSGTGAALGGMAFTLITGVVVDRFGYGPIFVAAGVMPLAAVSILLATVRQGSGSRIRAVV